ncbi:LysR family transcriptional regulator [Limnohabitans sp. JirII-29]|uniref:LysR substrate-binding domain-containing protein n=1 Tax=Limnohabitans sp. JirII-29 TaxID=1835756 RepID=UPI000D3A48C6|nr:LysR substrate-binding domain-containing protein [Limnohabitans sp. JirII-29]PUE27819.1 LysR family transcriptional regulator [Limnohabitans sp. JirII-29]
MRRKIPSTQALLCFDAAARHESYTRAAQELVLTQSAVSRQVTLLEDFLGLKLFRRTRHGVALTPAGVDYARQVGQRLDGLERDTLDTMTRQGTGGHLTLAAVPTFATHWLIPRLATLAQRHPDITVHIDTRTRPFLFADTAFDAALYTGTPEQVRNWPGTRADKLLDEEVVPVCSPQLMAGRTHLTPKALAQLPLLQQSTRPEGWRQWFDAMGVSAPNALGGPRYELFSMLAVAATHHLGVALMPRLLIAGELARGELVVACPKALRGTRSYYLITPDVGHAPGVLTRFRTWVQEQALLSTR